MIQIERKQDTSPEGLTRAQERHARAEAERTRAASIANPDPHPRARDPRDQGPDVGPSFQHRPAGRLETVFAVDPSHPDGARIRRARTRDPLRRMVKINAIPYRLYVAADSFREDLDKAEGGRDMGEALARALSRAATDTPPPPVPWHRSNHMAPGQWGAQRRLQRAWRDAIGLVAGGVFVWVVVKGGTLRDYSACKGIPRPEATATLKAALARLADFYAVGDVNPPPEWELDVANPIQS